MRTMHRGMLILLLTAITLFATSGSSVAQAILRLEQLQVDLWPEYDQPAMLVIYRGRLADDVDLPATLTLHLPARVKRPNAVAYNDGSGNLLNATYSTRDEGEWVAVTLETPTPDFQLEFYDSLARKDELRSYTFVWPGDYAVGQFSFFLLPPPGAEDIRTEPALTLVQQLDTDTLGLGGVLDSKLAVGQAVQLTVSYDGSAIPSPAGEDDGKVSPLIIGAVVAGLLLLIASGVSGYVRRPKPQSKKTFQRNTD
jgi:hypothetical protein